MSSPVAQRVALVTGASSGIGRAVAERLYRDGYSVAVCARRLDRLHALASELEADDARWLALAVDLRDTAAIEHMFRDVVDHFGGVDVLVNNAGLGYATSLVDGETDKWREMLEVNVLALCVCTREAVRDMRRRDVAGHIVHVSSMSAHRVPAGSGVYSATKFAVRSLTEGLRQELRALGSGIRVTAISPGFVETGFAAHYQGSEEAARRTYSRFEVLQPRDIADSVAYVLAQPPHVQIHDLLVRPTQQPS